MYFYKKGIFLNTNVNKTLFRLNKFAVK